MPITEYVAICQHCGMVKYVPGPIPDALPVVCPACADAGHSGLPLDCPVCRPAQARAHERRARIDAVLSEAATAEERARQERTRAAIAESRRDRMGRAPDDATFLGWLLDAVEPCIDADGNFTLEHDDERE